MRSAGGKGVGKREKEGIKEGKGGTIWLDQSKAIRQVIALLQFLGVKIQQDNSFLWAEWGKERVSGFYRYILSSSFPNEAQREVRGLFYFVQIVCIAWVTRVTSQPQNEYKPQVAKGNECSLRGRFQSETKNLKNTLVGGRLCHELKKRKSHKKVFKFKRSRFFFFVF